MNDSEIQCKHKHDREEIQCTCECEEKHRRCENRKQIDLTVRRLDAIEKTQEIGYQITNAIDNAVAAPSTTSPIFLENAQFVLDQFTPSS